MKNKELYQYDTFPIFKKELFINPRAVEKFCTDIIKPIKNLAPVLPQKFLSFIKLNRLKNLTKWMT